MGPGARSDDNPDEKDLEARAGHRDKEDEVSTLGLSMERIDHMTTTLDNKRVRELAGRVSGPVLSPASRATPWVAGLDG
jgi:hypothetical protein